MARALTIRDSRIERIFLDALAHGWTLSYACRVSGMHRDYVERLRQDDPAFDHAIVGATIAGKDWKLDLAKGRAFEGYVKKVKALKDSDGSLTGEVEIEHAYSDALALAILKADRPDEFNRGAAKPEPVVVKHEHSGPDGGPIEVVTRVNPKDRAKAVLALLAGADAKDLSSILGG